MPAVHYVSYFYVTVMTVTTWKRSPFKASTVQQTFVMSQETQRRGANYQRIPLIRLCSLALFMSTEAYPRSVGEPLTLVPDIHNQHIQNIFRPAHSLSLYHHLEPEHNLPFLKVLSVSFWINAAAPIRVKSRWGCWWQECAIHATLYCKHPVQRKLECWFCINSWLFVVFLPLV